MKNLEKMAIESIVSKIEVEFTDDVAALTNLKRAFEEAKKNFQVAAGNLVTEVKGLTADIVDELSEEAATVLETEIATRLGAPFKLK